jgi:predicted RNase H-like HicB family nuclease
MPTTTYGLYLESGPKMRKTMVHVPELLGCIANGPTTADALAAAPDAIRRFLRFAAEHGEPLDAEAAFDTRVREHITQGQWLGNGDPTIMFGPDLVTPTRAETARLAARLVAIRVATVSMLEDLGPRELERKPAVGRALLAICEHVVESSRHYLRNVLGPVVDLDAVAAQGRRGTLPWPDAMREAAAPTVERLRAATTEELGRAVPHGAALWTSRKMLRRLLEHDWEHHREVEARLGLG